MIQLEIENNKFRVITQVFKTSWLPYTAANKKVVLLVLRLIEDDNGNPLFTYNELATILGNKGLTAAHDHVAKFRACGEEFDKALKTLRNKYKVDEQIIKTVLEILREYDPMLSAKKILDLAREKLDQEDISVHMIRVALEQISAFEIRKILKNQLAKGKVDYKEEYVFQRLFKLAMDKADKSEIACHLPEKLQDELKATVPIPIIESIPEILAQNKNSKIMECSKKLFEGEVDSEKISSLWNSPLGWKLWAFLLYFQGVSLSVIGGWIGVNKSTICRWLNDIARLDDIGGKMKKVAFSSKVAIDEKWIKISGKWWFLFAAVDCVTKYPLHTAIYPSNNGNYCKLFLLELKKLGYRPKVVITDGWNSYIESIATVFPQAEHLLCRFHVICSIFRRLKKARIFHANIYTAVGKLFKTHYKRTVKKRIENLRKLLAPRDVKQVMGGLDIKLPQVIKAVGSTWRPSTSNAVEGFFSKFDRFYRLKGPFVDQASAQKHLQLFLLGYILTIGAKGQPCPLEKAGGNVMQLPLYHMLNRPNILALKEKIAKQWQAA
ncbi:DDE-type integrase/transposase/recombinase [Myxococcota bacterium]|nr:DDE-type integrase/transposase/recombinase [Myxococcota bacterium]